MDTDRPIYILSDLHLTHPYCDVQGIRRLLKHIENEQGKIILVGDTVDLWYSSRNKIDAECHELITRMRELVLFDVVGNHDSPTLHMPLFDNQKYPCWQLVIDERVWYIEHGHLVGKWAWVFKALDRWDEKVWFRKISRWCVNRRLFRFAGRETNYIEFRNAAIDRCKLKGGTVAVFGHTHHQELYRDMTGQFEVTYVNPGSALTKFQYAVYRDGKFTLEET